MKRLLILFSCATQLLNAQNYVPNHDFEYYLPASCVFFHTFLNFAVPWTTLDALPALNSQSNIGYLNECYGPANYGQTYAGVPQNSWGYAPAQSGKGYVVLNLGPCTYPQIETRSYMTVPLILKLKEGEKYCVSFYFSIAERSMYAYKNWGLHFSSYRLPYNINTQKYIALTPSLSNSIMPTDTSIWYYFNGSYIANGGESYLTIGNFNPPGICDITLVLEDGVLSPYIFIDNVCVSEWDNCICDVEHEWPKKPFDSQAIPNVLTPNGDGLNDLLSIESLPEDARLSIYNRWGKEVYQGHLNNKPWPDESISAGTYYLILQVGHEVLKKTITVIK